MMFGSVKCAKQIDFPHCKWAMFAAEWMKWAETVIQKVIMFATEWYHSFFFSIKFHDDIKHKHTIWDFEHVKKCG